MNMRVHVLCVWLNQVNPSFENFEVLNKNICKYINLFKICFLNDFS